MIIGLFLIFHSTVYLLFTSKIFNLDSSITVGDLTRLGYQLDVSYPRKYSVTLPKKHISGSQYVQGMHIDILTIGDSFSNGGGGGKNPFYQDYISSIYNLNVLNIRSLKNSGSIIETVITLNNSGVLDQMAPKAVIIEIGSREVVQKFSAPIIKDLTVEKSLIYKEISEMKRNDISKIPQTYIPFINTGNYNFFLNFFKYKLKNCLSNQVCRLELKEKFFTTKNPYVLEYYSDNTKVIPLNTYENIVRVNDNLNYVADLLKTKGIKLYVMIPVDKFDLYAPYLKVNPYPENKLFPILCSMKKDYIFINTKKMFSAELKNKHTQDLYFSDDTHWNYKASEIVVKNTPFNL